MTVAAGVFRRIYPGTGTATLFPFDWKIYSASDIAVYLTNPSSELLQVLNTDYTVEGVGSENGGNVVFNIAPTSDFDIVIIPSVTIEQQTDLRNQGRFYPETLERQFDLNVQMHKMWQEMIARGMFQGPALNGWDAQGKRIRNVGLPQQNTDAATKSYVDNAVASAGGGGGSYPQDPVFTSITFDGAPENFGDMSWNSDEETVDLTLGSSTLQLGHELLSHVRNNQPVAVIPNGAAVMAVGTLGASGRVLVERMDASVNANNKAFIGIATQTIGGGEDGKVTRYGKVRGVDLSAFEDGDLVYCDQSALGGLTNIEPASGLKVAVGYVIDATPSGTLFVKAVDSIGFKDLYDTSMGAAQNKDIFEYISGQLVPRKPFRESVDDISPAPGVPSAAFIGPGGGTIKYLNTDTEITLADGLSNGDSITMMASLSDAVNGIINWPPSVKWASGAAPVFSGAGVEHVIVFWKVNGNLYADHKEIPNVS